MKNLIFLLCLTAMGTARAECLVNEAGYTVVAGAYICGTGCTYPGRTAYISQNGNALTLTNDSGIVSSATISLNSIIMNGVVVATVNNRCSQITFTNNAIMIKY
ncbi:hypothetical protein [Burkholderia sp. TSV86]|uniref:hypothetical protein n=1 Tax=Burkholderia sp. TSV86 TaxID=1385594 RepID=UPI0012E3B8C7|nr:hypothetical protein [Burkholderia sp. TSV86]